MNTRFITRSNRFFIFVFALAFISLLSACGGDDAAVVNANPTGYYTGTAAVVVGTAQAVDVQDLQGLVDGNRFMAMSEAQELLYDGTITSINGNNFSATVKVYKDGALVVGSPTSFTGQIAQGSQITGTFSGSGDWRGTFTLGYAPTNNVASALATVASGVDEYWGGSDTTNNSTDPQFQLDANGNVATFNVIGGGVMEGCEFDGTFVPVANTRLYRLTVNVDICVNGNVEGLYTGLATTKDDDATLVMVIALGDYANASDYIRRLIQ